MIKQWARAVSLDGDDRLGRAGRLSLKSNPPVDGCAVINVAFETAPTWHQCGMPVFGLVDLEVAGLNPFGICLHHLNSIAADAPYIPIRPVEAKP